MPPGSVPTVDTAFVTFVPRGRALSVTYQRPEDDRYNYPEGYLRARIIDALGGRSAEEIVYGTRTTGAESNIEQATDFARRMVTRWGMSEKLGTVELAPRQNPYLGGQGGYGGEGPYSEETARAIDGEVSHIIDESHEEARRLLTEHRKKVEALAQALLEREALDEREILKVTGPRPPRRWRTGRSRFRTPTPACRVEVRLWSHAEAMSRKMAGGSGGRCGAPATRRRIWTPASDSPAIRRRPVA